MRLARVFVLSTGVEGLGGGVGGALVGGDSLLCRRLVLLLRVGVVLIR